MRRLAAAALCGFALSASAPTASLPQLLASHAATISANDFAFKATTLIEPMGEKKPPVLRVETFDPGRPAGKQWVLESVDGRAPTERERKEAARARAGGIVPTYGRLALYIGQPTSESRAGGRTVLDFTPLPKGVVMIGRKDISADTRARATVNGSAERPWVERVEIETMRPMSMMLVAKIESFRAVTGFARLPDGRPVPVRLETVVTGTMFGKSGTLRTTATFSEHRPAKSAA